MEVKSQVNAEGVALLLLDAYRNWLKRKETEQRPLSYNEQDVSDFKDFLHTMHTFSPSSLRRGGQAEFLKYASQCILNTG